MMSLSTPVRFGHNHDAKGPHKCGCASKKAGTTGETCATTNTAGAGETKKAGCCAHGNAEGASCCKPKAEGGAKRSIFAPITNLVKWAISLVKGLLCDLKRLVFGGPAPAAAPQPAEAPQK